ncbi:MAG: lipase family protein [Agrobacterium sp.]|uniref:lipase family protein n=1 Tax=Agrobacterium sp. TaxID=361 RepID=UPI00403433A9
MPLVRSHLVTSPGAKVTLTGHSLGGSLATLLQVPAASDRGREWSSGAGKEGDRKSGRRGVVR